MADIKTKDNAKGTIRTIDKAAVATVARHAKSEKRKNAE